jgi:hypothetical protein
VENIDAVSVAITILNSGACHPDLAMPRSDVPPTRFGTSPPYLHPIAGSNSFRNESSGASLVRANWKTLRFHPYG